MNEIRTTSMLQRVPVILAVTASSYGLAVPAEGSRKSYGTEDRRRGLRQKAAAVDGKLATHR